MSGSRNSNKGNYDADTYMATHHRQPITENRTASNSVHRRASEARESFKRRHTVVLPSTLRSSAQLTGNHEQAIESGRKHTRRLGNNQKSADAKKVYINVLRKEAKKTLQSEMERRNLLERTLELTTEQTKQAKRERERIRRESQLGTSSTGNTSSSYAGSSSQRRR